MSQPLACFLGVDGGGTKTRAVLTVQGAGDCDTLLGVGEAPASNPLSVGWERSFQAISQALQAALKQAKECYAADGQNEGGLSVKGLVLAIAGCADPTAHSRMQAWAEQSNFAERSWVVTDTTPVLSLAQPGEPALGLIAGTGSVVLARDAQGTSFMTGGWGYLIDDAGSGFSLGRALLNAATFAQDCRPNGADELVEQVLRYAGIDRVEGLKKVVYQAEDARSVVASFAPLVLQLAAEGNLVAAKLVAEEASRLVAILRAAYDRLEPVEPLPLYLAGSVLQRSSYYRTALRAAIQQEGLRIGPIRFAPEGACGCARLAQQLASK